ncbi:MAG: flavin reductase family protein [Cryobacterium sp.]|uniref:flavin reductase family protein n=1 Tax=unclassified Cryobacterium TaxID=2649013 RepID=UPI0018CA1989|nr:MULTISPECIES: flavin reductase family protein [unclassified Cryobacterium]MCY7404109.1 flavin reductase family protein [Cryobacterium sp.]MEC5153491.1 flavin reductase (DIM6/NTAB) family NADH-FMN oxidoreductase RutF [Cryobacterium sp. CAN_C3]
MRTDFDPRDLPRRDFYRLLNSLVVPRPIAWVSSRSAAGVDNLAPHSFFTVASVSPAIVQFTSVGVKDTVRNVLATGDFVVNFTPESLFEEVNATGTDFGPEESEFDRAGLTREPSLTVGSMRVAQSPAAIECRLHSTLKLGDCTLVFGEVTHIAVSSAVLNGAHPLIEKLRPLSRLGLDEWGTIGEVKEIKRIRASDWPREFRPHQH